LDVIEDSLSLIEGDITKRQSNINLAETVQEAFYDIISKNYIERKKKQEVEIDLELENMEGVIFKGDQRKILNMFRVLFNNSWQVWQERNDEAREKLQGMEVFKYRETPLKIKISFKLEQGKPMFEISVTDNAGGARKDKTLLDYSKEEPDRQIAFLLNITRRQGDTGLGLAEVWWFVKLHKGHVRFDNLVAEDGEITGAKFTIELPISNLEIKDTINRNTQSDSSL
jgi:nitrogen fixation/metabolism regulation signal transduction histidine kinase